MQKRLVFTIFAFLLIAPTVLQSAHAADTWYPGMGLKPGDYFRYSMGWVQWENGAPIEMDVWVKNDTSNGINLEMVVHDGSNIQKGIVTIGHVTPDPISFDPNMADYANYFKRTLGWLDAFATKAGPIDPFNPVYGRAGLFGEVTIGSSGSQTVSVPAGSFKTSAVYFRDSGVDSYIWVDPSLPFPVKAKVYAIKTSGAPTIGYQFEMLEHGNSKQPPSFLDVQSTGILGSSAKCPTPDYSTDFVHDSRPTDSNTVTVEYLYSPAHPHQGCPMKWRIWFEPMFSSSQRISDIHYDIYTVDDQGKELSSLAKGLGRADIYSSIGEDEQTVIVKQAPPVSHYIIYVAGTGSQDGGVTDVSKAGLVKIDVKVAPPLEPTSSTTTNTGNMTQAIPEFPLSAMMVMAIVVGLTIMFARIHPRLSGIRLS